MSQQDDSGAVAAEAGPTPYQRLGGDAAVRALIDRFYDLIDREPAYRDIRKLHVDLARSRDKLYWFLSGWLGGPKLYVERYGHPRLRARHLPFAIGVTERDQWLACMTRAMSERQIEPELARELLQALGLTADWMRNRFG